ncbi:TPA_asm: membrane protein [Mycobacterium phage McProf]|nr:TPA_asm: membrane protein [Mycobacterium phage McProf]
MTDPYAAMCTTLWRATILGMLVVIALGVWVR